MNWQACAPPPPKSPPAAIKAAMSNNGKSLALYFTAASIEEYFGGEMAGRRFTVLSAFENGAAHLRIVPDQDGDITGIKSMRNSARLILARFAACLPDQKITATPCKVISLDEETGALVLRLPEWADVPPMPPKAPRS